MLRTFAFLRFCVRLQMQSFRTKLYGSFGKWLGNMGACQECFALHTEHSFGGVCTKVGMQGIAMIGTGVSVVY